MQNVSKSILIINYISCFVCNTQTRIQIIDTMILLGKVCAGIPRKGAGWRGSTFYGEASKRIQKSSLDSMSKALSRTR
jgi:hypothetical protein